MQYLLTETEFSDLGPLKKLEKYRNDALALAKMVAATEDNHGCVAMSTGPYCSECGAKDHCPYPNKAFPK